MTENRFENHIHPNAPLWSLECWSAEVVYGLPNNLMRWFVADILEKMYVWIPDLDGQSAFSAIWANRLCAVDHKAERRLGSLSAQVSEAHRRYSEWPVLGRWQITAYRALECSLVPSAFRALTETVYFAHRAVERGRKSEFGTWMIQRLRYLAQLWNLTEDRQWWIMDCLLHDQSLPLECPESAKIYPDYRQVEAIKEFRETTAEG